MSACYFCRVEHHGHGAAVDASSFAFLCNLEKKRRTLTRSAGGLGREPRVRRDCTVCRLDRSGFAHIKALAGPCHTVTGTSRDLQRLGAATVVAYQALARLSGVENLAELLRMGATAGSSRTEQPLSQRLLSPALDLVRHVQRQVCHF